jgi:carbon monoxide dehydrogenase subunit G
MPTMITAEKQINAPPERVFALASSFATMPERIPGIKRVEMLTDGPVGVGTRFNETRVMFGKEATETMEVTAFDPPRSYNLVANSCGCIYDSRFECTPSAGGTLVTLTFNITAVSFFAKLMSPLSKLMSGMMRKCFDGDLEAIKKAAEAA